MSLEILETPELPAAPRATIARGGDPGEPGSKRAQQIRRQAALAALAVRDVLERIAGQNRLRAVVAVAGRAGGLIALRAEGGRRLTLVPLERQAVGWPRWGIWDTFILSQD